MANFWINRGGYCISKVSNEVSYTCIAHWYTLIPSFYILYWCCLFWLYLYKMRTVLKHAFLWITIYVVYTYMLSFYDDLRARALTNVFNVLLFMVAYYTLKHVQIPFLYKRGKKVLFGLSLALSALIISVICRINGILWIDNLFGKEGQEIPFMTAGSYLLKTVRFYTPAIAILAWESHVERGKELERMRMLEKEKVVAELKYLKAQINPHFLFNTLNNLYSFVVTQSPKAPALIMHLSNMLDYVLYRSQQPYVTLGEEIETIHNFISLEEMRYGDRLTVEVTTKGNMDCMVSPLLLLSLIENAFKHGASGDIGTPRIDIEIEGLDNEIKCRVWNTKNEHKGEINDAYKEGIGLSNIRRQLSLIYPDKFDMEIIEDKRSFCVLLQIQLTHE